MASLEMQQKAKPDSNASLKFAIAMALYQSNRIQKPPSSSSYTQSDALKWKQKAKERKQEILRLREDLKEAEDGSQFDLFPQSASCKCYFFDNMGKMSPRCLGDDCDKRFSDVLRRRFLRQVRLKERRRSRTDGSTRRHCLSDYNSEDETEQLRASADFLVELCNNASSVKADDTNFANWSHQAVDFILAALKNILYVRKATEPVEEIVSGLVMQLVRRMSATSQGEEKHEIDMNAKFCIQHLIRKLGSEPYIGQRVILSVTQRIYLMGESLLFMDPFAEAFPHIHNGMYMLIQVVEFLISDYLLTWSSTQGFDTGLFEECVLSILNARKALELLENRIGLYILYMDRVIGELAKNVSHTPSLQKLNHEILDKLFQ